MYLHYVMLRCLPVSENGKLPAAPLFRFLVLSNMKSDQEEHKFIFTLETGYLSINPFKLEEICCWSLFPVKSYFAS